MSNGRRAILVILEGDHDSATEDLRAVFGEGIVTTFDVGLDATGAPGITAPKLTT
jgi:hypothetical protein